MNAILNTLRKMFRSASRPSARRGVALRLESLEERCVPSQITGTPTYPASAIVAVVSVFPDGQKIDGTGAVVDVRHVLTAGTMIYDPQYGGWATQIAVFAGTTSSTSYVTSAYATLGRVEPAFYNTMNYNSNTCHKFGESGAGIGDIGLLTLSNSMGNATGNFELGVTTNAGSNWTGSTMYTMGYPQPLTDGFEMFQQVGPISGAVNAGHYEAGNYDYGGIFPGPSSVSLLGLNIFEFGYFDFSQSSIQEEPVQGGGAPYGAQSGSPLFGYDFGQPTIYGVMSAANSTTGYAEQITGDIHNDLQSWMDADNLGTTGVSPSDAVNLAQAVLQTQTTLQASASGPVSYGQSVTFTAYVSTPDAPCPPTGSNITGETVSFYDNGALLGTGTLRAASSTQDSASFTISTLSVGNHSITAIYNAFAVSGGILFHSSTSGADTGTVVKAETTTDLTGPTSAVTVGQPATFTAYVSGSASYPTGTVTFYDGGTVLGTAQLIPHSNAIVPIASASFTTSALGVGSHSITAVYSGDSHFASSTSAAVTETVPAFVVSEFPGAGVWRYDSATGWQQLSPYNASQVAVDAGGDVVAEFRGAGVWRYEDATGWRQLSPYNAAQIAIAGNGIIAAEFSGAGVWRYEDATGWRQLSPYDASQVALDANGDVAAVFNGVGVWRYEDATGWRQLSTYGASQVSISGDGIVAAEFSGAGVWRYEDATGWRQLSPYDASRVAVDSRGDVAAEFNGAGVWLFQDGLSWGQLSAANAQDIDLGG